MTPREQEWRDRPLPERTVLHLLRHQASAAPDKVFLTGDGFSATYGRTLDLAFAIGGGLRAGGVERGDRVGIWLDNGPEFVFTWFGVAAAGAVQVPLNPDVGGHRLVHAVNHSGCETLVLREHQLLMLEAHLAELTTLRRVVVIGRQVAVEGIEVLTYDDLAASTPVEGIAITARDTAAIMFTSGSTGTAKGVVLPHGQHVTNGEQALRHVRIRPDDVLLVVLPLHHNMAQGYGVMAALAAGATVWLETGFKRATFWKVVEQSRATVFPFVGALLVLLDKQADEPGPHRLRAAYGVPIAADLHARFEARFGVRLIHGYGSTEATIVAWGSAEGERALGSAGQLDEGFDVVVVDEFDEPVERGGIGEICVRPRRPYSMFQGYYAEPERGREAVRNLWFHSGDRGRIDGLGNLWFEGRAGDALRRFGEFISATEVEQAFAEHDAVELVAVVGLADEVAGQEVLAMVVPRTEASVTAAELRAWVSARLPGFAVPRYVEVAEDLPMTPTGKVEKHKIVARGISGATTDFRKEPR